jgi:hypothetical protein
VRYLASCLALLLAAGCESSADLQVSPQTPGRYDTTLEGSGSDDPVDPAAKERARGRLVEGHSHNGVPIVTLPGFEMYDDGSSRVFVEVSENVSVSEWKQPHLLTYRFEGVFVPERVNRLAIPTQHFDSPVGLVRIVQVLGGAELRVYLRQTSEPKTRLKRSDGGTVLSVDFPRLRPDELTAQPWRYRYEEEPPKKKDKPSWRWPWRGNNYKPPQTPSQPKPQPPAAPPAPSGQNNP